MTPPVNKRVQLSAYTGVNAGIVRNAANENYANVGATLGGEVSWRGAFARAQVGVGTAVSTNLQLGYEFDIGRNMGLELSANAQRSQSLVSKGSSSADLTSISNMSIVTPDKTYDYQASSDGNISTKYPLGETRIGAQAKLNFGSSKARFGVGIEAGMHSSDRQDVTAGQGHQITGQFNSIQYSGTAQAIIISNESNGYVTPTLSADVKLGKNFSLNANADLYQGNVGIRYNF